MDPVGVLLRTPIFRDLSARDVEELLPDLRERRYGRGDVVWLEGAPARELVIVADGQLKAHRVSRDGRELIVGVYVAFATTGEVGLFHPRGVRWLGLSAMTPTTCLTLHRAPLEAFLTRHPPAMARMLEQLSITAVRAAYAYTGVAFDGIGRRVAAVLLQLALEHGEESPAGLRIGVRLSQGELAAHVAATRENVNRALSGLVSGGVISQQGGYFHVHDRPALEEVADSG